MNSNDMLPEGLLSLFNVGDQFDRDIDNNDISSISLNDEICDTLDQIGTYAAFAEFISNAKRNNSDPIFFKRIVLLPGSVKYKIWEP